MNLVIAIAFAAAGSVIVGLVLRVIFRNLDPSKISDYRPCRGGWWEAELNNCASGLAMVPQQPVNTYTNLAYIAVGFFLTFKLNTLPVYILSLNLLYLCAGSSLYHAISTKKTGSLDVSAIYALFSALTIYAIFSFFGLDDSFTALIMFIVAALSGYLLRYRYRGSMAIKIGIFLALAYIFTIWSIIKTNQLPILAYSISSFVLFLMAYAAWYLDKKRIFPFKRWGHGLWHIFTAAATSLLIYATYLIR
jgi:predicted membrane channel-forming protein YqfA (hemolysin III family)